MPRIFFILFITYEILIILTYIIIILLRNRKYHYLSTIELQGYYVLSTLKKEEPFNLIVWSVSNKKYVEYLVDVDPEKKIKYTKTNKVINEQLSRDKYFDVRIGDFVLANYNQPFFNPKLNYFYGRTFLKQGENDALTAEHDDPSANVERVFISFIRKQNEFVYELDLENQKLVNIVKSAFPNDRLAVEWNIARYYEYLNDGNKDAILPDAQKSDPSVEIKRLFFEYSNDNAKWKLLSCPADMIFERYTCVFDPSKIIIIPRSGRAAPSSFKTKNFYANLDKQIDIPSREIKQAKHVSREIHFMYDDDVEDKTVSSHQYKTHSGYNAIDRNFHIHINPVTKEYFVERLSLENLLKDSTKVPDVFFHMDMNPNEYILNGKLYDAKTPVIFYENKQYYSNPILFEMINQIHNPNKISKSEIKIEQNGVENFPQMKHIKYIDNENKYPDLIDNIIAIKGVYGENIVANIIIAKSVFKSLLLDNIQIAQFENYLNRDHYFECSHDFYSTSDFSLINNDVLAVMEKYVFLNVFDLYDNFDKNNLRPIAI